MLHAAAGGRQAGRMQRKKVRTASKQAIVDAVLLACTSSTSRCCGRPAIQKQNFCGCCVDLPCARRRTSKWPFSRRGGATVLRMARCGTKRQDGEEGRAEAVMRAVSKHYVSARRTAEAMMAMPLTRYELHVPCSMSPCPLYRRPRVWRSEIDMWRLAYVAQAQRRS